MYGPGSSFMALKERHVSSTSTGPCTCGLVSFMSNALLTIGWNYCFGCSATFVCGDLFNCALNLGEINGLALKIHCISKNSLHFGELVLVTSDEVELFRGHGAVFVSGFLLRILVRLAANQITYELKVL